MILALNILPENERITALIVLKIITQKIMLMNKNTPDGIKMHDFGRIVLKFG